MPYYIRAKTYYRYAEEQLAEAEKARDPKKALKFSREAVERAARALWAIVQIEAPKSNPSLEEIMGQLDRAVEPWLAREIRKAWERINALQDSPGVEEAREAVDLARFVVKRTKEVLEPIIGPTDTLFKKRKFYLI